MPDVSTVDIAVDTFEWLKSSKFIGYFNIAKIPGMPYFVAVFKVFENCIVKVTVRVGNEAYFNHLYFI